MTFYTDDQVEHAVRRLKELKHDLWGVETTLEYAKKDLGDEAYNETIRKVDSLDPTSVLLLNSDVGSTWLGDSIEIDVDRAWLSPKLLGPNYSFRKLGRLHRTRKDLVAEISRSRKELGSLYTEYELTDKGEAYRQKYRASIWDFQAGRSRTKPSRGFPNREARILSVLDNVKRGVQPFEQVSSTYAYMKERKYKKAEAHAQSLYNLATELERKGYIRKVTGTETVLR